MTQLNARLAEIGFVTSGSSFVAETDVAGRVYQRDDLVDEHTRFNLSNRENTEARLGLKLVDARGQAVPFDSVTTQSDLAAGDYRLMQPPSERNAGANRIRSRQSVRDLPARHQSSRAFQEGFSRALVPLRAR